MKKNILLGTLFFCLVNSITAQKITKEKPVFEKNTKSISNSGFVRCSSNEYEEMLRSQYPKMETRAQFETWISKKIEEQKAFQTVSSQSGGIIYIPVVVHVIHNGDAYGVNENITDEQVESQITVMTQDFRKMTGTPGFNTNPVGADTQIEFVLAKVDPSGNPTNGINRVNLCQESWSRTGIQSTVKPSTIWDATQYMNMWSVNFTDTTLLGYAQFPSSSGLTGLNANGGLSTTDGVVANHNTFGSRILVPSGTYGGTQYDEGRTMTHEVGHYLGLIHLWGDGDCTVDDFCNDTPNCNGQYFAGEGTGGCTKPIQCDGLQRQTENYMDYSDDSCMNIFTVNQKTRITTVMNNSPRRLSLKTSTKDLPIALFANDAEVKIDAYCSSADATCIPPVNQHRVFLYNRGTANLTSAAISHNEGGASAIINWTGNLAPNKYATIVINAVLTTGTFNASVSTTNGVTDQRTTNNTASKTFVFTPFLTPPDYLYTTYNFTLVGDRYGEETTWNIKNATGTTLYSGGPYTRLAASGTQPLVTNVAWNLPANGCYTFTINDSANDGINSTPTNYGAGFYNLKANAGAVTVFSNTTFSTATTKHTFTNGTLSTNSFDLLDATVLYPNPTTDILNISISNGVGLPYDYEIFNSIGQSIQKNKITKESDLSLSTLQFSSGIYFLKVSKDNSSKTLRFFKN
ncbi:T9SS type A sorting domain-containing protein [Flavobacterium sp.]|uniref:T9SS type A sorting domain-containing protein n=1 Tax=Flavobacterium sp. TaxID=239 RepID=UPI00286DD0B8|nr:T9SS type A sorting domain-containing protein [Flavobacterium sp.]